MTPHVKVWIGIRMWGDWERDCAGFSLVKDVEKKKLWFPKKVVVLVGTTTFLRKPFLPPSFPPSRREFLGLLIWFGPLVPDRGTGPKSNCSDRPRSRNLTIRSSVQGTPFPARPQMQCVAVIDTPGKEERGEQPEPPYKNRDGR